MGAYDSHLFCGVHYLLVVPHVTDEVQEWVTRVARMPVPYKATPATRNEVAVPDVCLIEVRLLASSLALGEWAVWVGQISTHCNSIWVFYIQRTKC